MRLKALILVLSLAFVCTNVHADEIPATFDVNEYTFVTGPGSPPGIDTANTEIWQITGPINGAPVADFFADMPIIFDLLGLDNVSPIYAHLANEACTIVSPIVCSEEQEELFGPTSLPAGLDLSSTVTIENGAVLTPEPGTWLHLLTGIAALAALVVRRRVT